MTEQGTGDAPAGPWARLAALAAVIALAAALVAALVESGDSGGPAVDLSGAPLDEDPFAYEDARRGEFEARAAAGVAHVLYANSPGGATETARMVSRYRDEIERAASGSQVDPDVLEAMVFLESAGRSQVIAGDDPEAAAGLAQIVASTATSLLGMQVDLEESRRLTKQINRAYEFGQAERAERLTAERARIDERFDPEAALAGAVRYLEEARARFGSDDLAVVSYHMGIGNLENVISTYVSEEPGADPGDLPYAEIYFASSPLDHPATWELLSSFGDESSEYLWKVRAAEGIMRLYAQRPRGAARARGAARRQGNRGGGLPPARRDRVVRRPRRAGGCLELGRDRPRPGVAGARLCDRRRDRPPRRGSGRRPGAVSRPAPRGRRGADLPRGADERGQRRRRAAPDERRPRRLLPGPAHGATTLRRPTTTRCTPRAGRSTSRATTSPTPRARRSSSPSTASRRSRSSTTRTSLARST